MRANEVELAEQKLNRFADIALYHQSFWLFVLAILLAFKPYYIKDAGQCLGMSALLASFIASRIYIHAGKKGRRNICTDSSAPIFYGVDVLPFFFFYMRFKKSVNVIRLM